MNGVSNHADDMAGKISGQLLVIRADGKANDGHVAWICRCTCGKEKRISSQSLRRKSPVKSCGCINRVRAQERRKVEGAWNEGKSYVISGGLHCYKTRHAWAKAVLKFYGNQCERCGWNLARCDVHHRELKSEGGLHTIANGVVLCPNHHRLAHS